MISSVGKDDLTAGNAKEPLENEFSFSGYSSRFMNREYADAYHRGIAPKSMSGIVNFRRLGALIIAKAEVAAIRRILGKETEGLLLDAPCGSGKVLRRLMRENSSVIGVDSSTEMLAHIVNFADGPFLIRADLRTLPFAEGSVDVVICNRFLHRIPVTHQECILREMWRVTRSHAVFYFAVRRRLTDVVERLEVIFRLGNRGTVYYVRRGDIALHLAKNGWKVDKEADVLPIISGGHIVLAFKETQP